MCECVFNTSETAVTARQLRRTAASVFLAVADTADVRLMLHSTQPVAVNTRELHGDGGDGDPADSAGIQKGMVKAWYLI